MGQKVTYLICNFNNANWIRNAIISAQKQTIDCNICVIDDKSTDDSIDVITSSIFPSGYTTSETEYYKKHTDGKDILIECFENHGPSYARNLGIKETCLNTDFYAILDADDENYPTKIEKALFEFRDELVGVVYADYDILNVDTGIIRREYKERFVRSRLFKECIVHSGSIIRAGYLSKVVEPSGWYDINLRCAEDYDLWLRMSEVCLISHIPESLSLVRVHNNNSTNSVNKEIWQQCWQRVQQKTYDRANKKNQART